MRPPQNGNFYLKVNGRDFLVRGATYTPDLLYRYDRTGTRRSCATPRISGEHAAAGIKISSTTFVEMADELGIPLMYGWMCCNQWEKWQQWDDEDRRVAKESLRSQIEMLRSHPAVFIWANGGDGRPPEGGPGRLPPHPRRTALAERHRRHRLGVRPRHRRQTVVGRHPDVRAVQLAAAVVLVRGALRCSPRVLGRQGDNEHIPPYASLKRFIPADKLWPINDTWFFHAGSNQQNSTLSNVRRVVDSRYGPSTGAEMFADKAQLAHYEATRAQFEAFAANGWDGHKMTIYWMLNSHWPSFFGNIFDYYLRPGGAYFGAKKGFAPAFGGIRLLRNR